jgi:Uncharacterized MobA-related protein
MGRDKALLPWPPAATKFPAASGQTLLAAQIAALKPITDEVVVVAGTNSAHLLPVINAGRAILAENPDPDRGQFSSLQVGLQALVARGYDAAIITLVDSPPLSSESLKRLSTAFEAAIAQEMWGVTPENGGKRGHPLFARRQLIDAFLAAPVTGNARSIKHRHAHLIESIPVDDLLLSVDVNTPEQYQALISGEREKA